jgi:RHS repeat-associated protein
VQDVLGRAVSENIKVNSSLVQQTSHTYSGRYETTVPPDSSKSPTRTLTDGFGRIEESALIESEAVLPAASPTESPLPVLDVAVAVKSDGTEAIFQVANDRQVYFHESSPVTSWTALTNIGCCGLDRLSATVLPNGAYAIAARATDGAIWVKRQSYANGPWGAFVNVANKVAVDVGLTTNSAGQLALVVAGTDGAVYLNQETSTDVWGGWTSLSGGGVDRVAAARYTDGALVFAVKTVDNYFHTKRQLSPGGAFEAAWNTRGCCITDISAVVAQSNPGILAVYGPGGAGIAYRQYESVRGGAWTAWESMGGSGIVNMAAATLTNGCGLEIGQVAGAVQKQFEVPCGAWSGWASVVRQVPAPTGDVAIASKPDGTQALFQVTPDNQVWWRESSGRQGWTAVSNVGCCEIARISATALPDGRYALAARTIGGSIVVKRQLTPGGPWGNWTSVSGLVLDVGLSTDNNGNLALAVVGTDGAAYYSHETSEGVWTGWASLAGGGIRRISLGRYADGVLVVVVATLNGDVFTNLEPSAGAAFGTTWVAQGSVLTDVAATISQGMPGVLAVYGPSTGGIMYRKYEFSRGGTWNGWEYMGGSGYTSAAAGKLSNGCGVQAAIKADGYVDIKTENPCGTWDSWTRPRTTIPTSYTYTTLGAVDTVTDPAGYVTDTNYDMLGRVTSISDPNAGMTTVAYDLNSNVVRTTDARGTSLTTVYDQLNRPTQLRTGTSPVGGVLLNSAAFDAPGEKGLLNYSSSFFEGAEYKTDITGYNDAYQPIQTTITIPSAARTAGLAGTYVYGASYRADGTGMTDSYPAMGGLPAETISYGFAATGQPTTTSGTDAGGSRLYVQSTAYDTLGRISSRVLGDPGGSQNGNVLRGYGYDFMGRLSTLTAAARTGLTTVSQVQSDVYGFDVSGNVTSKTDSVAGQSECFSYDTRNRLVRAFTQAAGGCGVALQDVGPDPFERTYGFDAQSRLTSVAKRTGSAQALTPTSYAYGALAPGGCAVGTQTVKPHAVTSVPGVASFGYDCAGNQTSRTTALGAFTQVFNEQGRLASVTKTGYAATYIYGPNGQRLIQEDGTKRTAYLPGQELVSVNGAAPTVTRYVTAGAGGPTAAMRNNTSVFVMGGDAQGSISWSMNTAGAVVTRARYYPYGEVRGSANQMPTNRGFVGQTEDDSTGLNYLNNRYQDPVTGVFLSVDPLVGKTGQAYLYASGNPTTLSDPTGLEPCGRTLTCTGEYGDQKAIADYNSNGIADTCNWWCARNGGGSSFAGNQLPSWGMYETCHGWTNCLTPVVGIGAALLCVFGCSAVAAVVGGCWAALAICGTAVGSAIATASPGLLAAANGEPVPYSPVAAGTGVSTGWWSLLAEGGGPRVAGELANLGSAVSRQRQLRHILDADEWVSRGQGGYFKSLDDAQAVLDATHNGAANILGRTRNGDLLVHFEAVTGYNNNVAAGYLNQPTNTFIVKGTSNVSVVPTNPQAMPAP